MIMEPAPTEVNLCQVSEEEGAGPQQPHRVTFSRNVNQFEIYKERVSHRMIHPSQSFSKKVVTRNIEIDELLP